MFKAFLSWKGPLDAEDDKAQEARKTAWFVPVAIDCFVPHLGDTFAGWEVAVFNGKPAKELSFQVDFGGGFLYRGYVDLVLYNPSKDLFLVLELKTTKNRKVDEAMFANSLQGLGYGVILDAIAKSQGLTKPSSYEVLYAVYSSSSYSWDFLPFKKSLLKRVQWLQHLAAQIERIKLYNSLDFWPMHGSSCFNFFRRCEYFGICNLNILHLAGVKKIEDIKHVDEDVVYDFTFSAVELLETITEIRDDNVESAVPDKLSGDVDIALMGEKFL